jgi:hypothetical protein
MGTKSSRPYKDAIRRTLTIGIVLSYKLSTTIKNRMILYTKKNGEHKKATRLEVAIKLKRVLQKVRQFEVL